MGYQALYRVFRPQSFFDMAGQSHITKTLQNALVREQFSHAYLFSGPRGTGKTSAAKVFAKAVNCEQAPVAEPCNECASCRGIRNGDISDVIEIDAASNNGVDEIREIRDKVKYAPNAVRYKIYIIDEVHMLSQGAFNALLKTLEEPPAHVIFILATTEPHKIPLTIVSRCQRFDFKRIDNKAIVERLKFVVEEEKLDVSERALSLIAKACEGGMRDALSILDQVIAFSEGAVNDEDVREITGMVSQQWLADIVDALYEKNAVSAVQTVNQLFEAGKDPERFVEDLILYYRDLLFYQTSADLQDQLTRAEPDERLDHQAKQLDPNDIYTSINELNRTQQDMKWSNHSRIHLEVVTVRLCRDNQTASSNQLQTLEQKVNELEQRLSQMGTVSSSQGNPAANQQTPPKKASPSYKGKAFTAPDHELKGILESATKSHLKQLRSSWPDVMEKVKSNNLGAHAWLLESKPVASSENAFIQAFKFDFHCQMVAENKNNCLEMAEKYMQEATGQYKKMHPVPIKQWDELKQSYINQMDSQKKQSNDEETAEDPLIKEAEKLVGPDLLEIKD